MSNEILYILLPDYAAHEVVFLAQAIASDEYALKENPKYVNKVVAPIMEPVKSIGGFQNKVITVKKFRNGIGLQERIQGFVYA